jgi:hypothetical protein
MERRIPLVERNGAALTASTQRVPLCDNTGQKPARWDRRSSASLIASPQFESNSNFIFKSFSRAI